MTQTNYVLAEEPAVDLALVQAMAEELEDYLMKDDLFRQMTVHTPAGDQRPQMSGSDLLVLNERHRHRYEVNMNYRKVLEANGLLFSGVSPDGKLPEIVERTDHPWFIGVQFHPELKSKPFEPHPLFASFIEAAKAQSRLV